ncbi:MAG: hypothetical protein R2862_08130 [Thermoanaerobaculia bacterium]
MTREQADAAKDRPLRRQPALGRRLAPCAVDAATAEARIRFGVTELAERGYSLFSTLDLGDRSGGRGRR